MNPKIYWTKDGIPEDSCSLAFADGRYVIAEQGRLLAQSLESGNIDGLVVEALWGFNDLGGYGRIIAELLGLSEERILDACFENQKQENPTLLCIESVVDGSPLKGAVLVPVQSDHCYRRWAEPFYGRPYRDFYYNVSYEALKFLADLGCTNLGIAGITGSMSYYGDSDVANCVAEAIVHCAINNQQLARVVSVGDGPSIVEALKYFNDHPERMGAHRDIQRKFNPKDGITQIVLTW